MLSSIQSFDKGSLKSRSGQDGAPADIRKTTQAEATGLREVFIKQFERKFNLISSVDDDDSADPWQDDPSTPKPSRASAAPAAAFVAAEAPAPSPKAKGKPVLKPKPKPVRQA